MEAPIQFVAGVLIVALSRIRGDDRFDRAPYPIWVGALWCAMADDHIYASRGNGKRLHRSGENGRCPGRTGRNVAHRRSLRIRVSSWELPHKDFARLYLLFLQKDHPSPMEDHLLVSQISLVFTVYENCCILIWEVCAWNIGR